MQVYIKNNDGSMLVHQIINPTLITWVPTRNKNEAQAFPATQAEQWVQLITKITGIQCSATTPTRPGML